MLTTDMAVYFGTMTFGWSQSSSVCDEAAATEMVKAFAAGGGTRLDTARIYAGGKTEPIVGATLASVPGLRVGTKAHPSQPDGLSATGIRAQLAASLEALGVKSVDEFYLHQPDTNNALEESLRAAHELKAEGLINKIGMSNYHASEVARAFELCATHGWAAPTVYQGLYNPLNRMVEAELLPVRAAAGDPATAITATNRRHLRRRRAGSLRAPGAQILRQHGCAFIAYNPLAAGLLTGKHADQSAPPKGRFLNNDNYLPRFYTNSNFDAVEQLKVACAAAEPPLTLVQATYRWLARGSALDATRGDGVLIGASSTQQAAENLAALADAAPLPPAVQAAFDGAYAGDVAAGAFKYWRSYSADMPGREGRDQGASYQAAKK